MYRHTSCNLWIHKFNCSATCAYTSCHNRERLLFSTQIIILTRGLTLVIIKFNKKQLHTSSKHQSISIYIVMSFLLFTVLKVLWILCDVLWLCLCVELAVSPNNNVVNIYEKKGKDWIKLHELTEHSGRITGIVLHFSWSIPGGVLFSILRMWKRSSPIRGACNYLIWYLSDIFIQIIECGVSQMWVYPKRYFEGLQGILGKCLKMRRKHSFMIPKCKIICAGEIFLRGYIAKNKTTEWMDLYEIYKLLVNRLVVCWFLWRHKNKTKKLRITQTKIIKQHVAYRHRLGPGVQPHRDLCGGPQCLRLDPEGRCVETHAGPGPDQPSGDLRQVVPAGEQVRPGQRGSPHLCVLLWKGEWLVIYSLEMHYMHMFTL